MVSNSASDLDEGVRMKISVTDRCAGHGRCYALSPAVYAADEDGFNVAVGTVIEVDDSLDDAARLGAMNCPERAIVIHDD